MYLFAYGSLRYGFELNHFLKESRFVGYGFAEGFEMYDLGSYPGVVKGDGIIWGEVYEINEDLLKTLDEVEDYKGKEDDLYTRYKTRVFFDQKRKYYLDGVYIYVYNQDISYRDKIESGDYSAYVGMPRVINYFAYAENTNIKILKERGVEKILKEINAILYGYSIIFNIKCKYGYCANLKEDPNGKVCGYIYLMNEDDLNSLDKAEEHLIKYFRETFKVVDENGKEYFASAYVSDYKEGIGTPKEEYLNAIKGGLRRKWGDSCKSSGLI
jgi:gamma-glutamylcyclotransferase (GGCT)/AIG2-like uncharacterized protein YtfP